MDCENREMWNGKDRENGNKKTREKPAILAQFMKKKQRKCRKNTNNRDNCTADNKLKSVRYKNTFHRRLKCSTDRVYSYEE